MQTYYELNHLWERRTAARGSFAHVQAEYYRQWREPDGSIPWIIHRIDRADPARYARRVRGGPRFWRGDPRPLPYEGNDA